MKSKRIISLCMALLLMAAGFSVPCDGASVAGIAIALNGKTLPVTAYMEKDTVMVPVESVSEALGAHTEVNAGTKGVSLLRGNTESSAAPKQSFVTVGGKKITLQRETLIYNGALYASQDFITAVFGFGVTYDGKKKVLSIQVSEMPIHFSKKFRIKYLDNGCKLVTDADNYKILLVPRGQASPKGVSANKTVATPPQKVMAGSATFVGAMAKLGVLDSLKVVTTSKDYWEIPAVKAAVASGKAVYVGGDNMEPPNYEMVKSLSPDLAFVYTGDVGQQPVMKKLSEIGIKYAVNNEWLEPDGLGRMEWMKFTAAFYDKEFLAEKLLNDAVYNVRNTEAKVKALKKPKVAWGMSWAGKTYITRPGSYVGKWITACGGDYVFKDHKVDADAMVSPEYFYAKAKDADIFIFSGTTTYMAEVSINQIVRENPLFANIKAVKEGNVYAYAPDWWQTIPETDIFVKDIAAAFHPEAYKGYKPQKLVKLPRK